MGKAHDEHTWVATYAVYTKKKQLPQTTSFKAFMAKHFTTVRAALAFTFTSLPNIIRLPALVAGLYLVLTMQMPGSVNFPVLFVKHHAFACFGCWLVLGLDHADAWKRELSSALCLLRGNFCKSIQHFGHIRPLRFACSCQG